MEVIHYSYNLSFLAPDLYRLPDGIFQPHRLNGGLVKDDIWFFGLVVVCE